MITKQLLTPLQLPAPPLPPDTTPESAKVYWYFKRGGPKSWCKGMVRDCVTNAHCLAGALLLVHDGDNFTILDKLDKIRREVRVVTAAWNDAPSTTFKDVLNLTRKLEL